MSGLAFRRTQNPILRGCPNMPTSVIGHESADKLEKRIKPDGSAVMMEADRFCMHWRGIKNDEPMMANLVMRGALLENKTLRHKFPSSWKSGKNNCRNGYTATNGLDILATRQLGRRRPER